MEERYELRGKIGQGGIGRVHRAFDHRMKREVAIKRILTSEDDPSLKDEATKQLMVEAGALASLQHPNIITVHDVGADDEGPYVVMELISGKTLDEIIESSPLTWEDFKQVATQSLEALIAAQELNMIHSDLKPPNIMLTWLPSGTFQVKIVDFGLATLIQNQSPEEIAAMDSVFGSVFFMPPEQFERVPLDTRSDLYSLGCCLYQALTGSYPFTGTTGAEVMEAHLNHQVIPIQEIRADIPLWACQWVMWLINRQPEDRPKSAREALSNFTQNDKESNPAMSQGGHPAKNKLILPGAAISATGLVPTLGAATSPLGTSAVHISGASGPISTITGMTPLGGPLNPEEVQRQKRKKLAIWSGIAAGVIILTGLIIIVAKRNANTQKQNEFENIAMLATTPNTRDVKLTMAKLQVVFDFISKSTPTDNIDRAYIILQKTSAADSSDVDKAIFEYSTQSGLPERIQIKMFEEVIAKRRRLEQASNVLAFCESSESMELASVAFESVRPIIREQDSKALISLIANTKFGDVRESAEVALEKLLRFSAHKPELVELINQAKSNANPGAVEIFDQLLISASESP